MGFFFVNIANYKSLFCTLILVLFVSCSTTKIAYNFADTMVLNWFKSYCDLRESQRLDLDKKVEGFFKWHRKSELPKVVSFLEEFKVRYADGFDQADIKWITPELKLFWKRILSYAEEDVASLLLTVDDTQILVINDKFLEEEDDWLIEQSKMTLGELRQDILERTYKALDNWFGDLESGQKEKIATWVKPDPYWVAVKLRNRKKFKNDLIDLLRSKETLRESIHFWMSGPESHWTDEYKTNIKGKIKEWKTITLKIDSMTLPKQRKHVIDKIDGFILDFKDLAGIEDKYEEATKLTLGQKVL
jgi:hypothetical protein